MESIIPPDFQKRKVVIFILKIILQSSVKKVTLYSVKITKNNFVIPYRPDEIVWRWSSKYAYLAQFKGTFCTFDAHAIWYAHAEGLKENTDFLLGY